MRFAIKEGGSVKIEIVGFEMSTEEAEDPSDLEWLNVRIAIDSISGVNSSIIDPCMQSWEAWQFLEWLEALALEKPSVQRSSCFEFLEPTMKFLSIQDGGSIQLEFEWRFENGTPGDFDSGRVALAVSRKEILDEIERFSMNLRSVKR